MEDRRGQTSSSTSLLLFFLVNRPNDQGWDSSQLDLYGIELSPSIQGLQTRSAVSSNAMLPPTEVASTVQPVTTSFETAGLKRISLVRVFSKAGMRRHVRAYTSVRFDPLKVVPTRIPAPIFRRTTVGSGGAYLHSGVAVHLERCAFVGNRASDEGLAILSLGIAENITDVVFDSNAFYCISREYGYEANVFEVRYTAQLPIQERHVLFGSMQCSHSRDLSILRVTIAWLTAPSY